MYYRNGEKSELKRKINRTEKCLRTSFINVLLGAFSWARLGISMQKQFSLDNDNCTQQNNNVELLSMIILIKII